MYSPINYETPDKKLDEVLYEVAIQPVYSEINRQHPLFKEPISTKNYLAVINQRDGTIVSIVGKNYRLIHNKEALDMGKHLFKLLYPLIKTDDLIPFKVISPQSLGSVQIDLIHKDVNFRVWEQETWLPFMRIFNSYNRVHALSFEIGFVRELCSNGMLFKKRTMIINYPHTKQQKINLESNAEQITSTQEIFRDHCRQLFNVMIPAGQMFPLVCHMMNLNLDIQEMRNPLQSLNRLERMVETVNLLTERYCGQNIFSGYDALNVLTDLVSHQDEYRNLAGYHLNTRSYYQKPSVLIDTLIELHQSGKPDIIELLAPTNKKLTDLQAHLGVKWNFN